MSITDDIIAEAQRQGVDPRLALEVAIAESNLNPNAVSRAGAIGIFQLMPATAAMLGVDPTNVEQNIEGGIRYLGQMLSQFGGNVAAALAAYDWGPTRVAAAIASYGSNWLGTAPGETQAYVSKILNALGQYTVSIQPATIVQSGVEKAVGGVSSSTWKTIGLGVAIFLGAYLVLTELADL